MGFEDANLLDKRVAAGGSKAAFLISCSICLEDVTDCGERAWAKLQCGHQFHLDCIGSAFNVKGVMQCPNCRKIEKGQWLYADGCKPHHESNIEDLVNDEEFYDLSYSGPSTWCPFGGFTRLAAAFEEVDFPTSPYHDIEHVRMHEHDGVEHGEHGSHHHMCPYAAYASDADPPPMYNEWNRQLQASEIQNPYRYSMDMDAQFVPTPRTTTNAADVAPRFGHAFLVGQSSRGAAMPPGSAARARERSQALEAYFQRSSSSSSNSSSRVQVEIPGGGSSSAAAGGGGGGIYYEDPQNSIFHQHHIWETDPHPFRSSHRTHYWP